MAKAKKKYGLDTFNKGYSVDVKETYGALIYLDTIASERFNYEDTETGAIYDSQAELIKNSLIKTYKKLKTHMKLNILCASLFRSPKRQYGYSCTSRL